MDNQNKFKTITLVVSLLLILIVFAGIFFIGFGGGESSGNSSNSASSSPAIPTALSSSSISLSSAQSSNTEGLREDFTVESYNKTIDVLNIDIRNLKQFTEFEVSQDFCNALGLVRSYANQKLPNLKLDVNFNDKAPEFERIKNETETLQIACKTFLENKLEATQEFKDLYQEYLKNLNELEKVEL